MPGRRTRVVVACDESGYEGEKLIGTTTDVFAHASVHLGAGPAEACMRELRERIRSPATEYKANHLLRDKHAAVLRWLLGPSAPLRGNGHVHLVDKAYAVLVAVVDLLLDDGRGEPGDRAAAAVTLYRRGPAALGAQGWARFLAAAHDLMRTRDRWDVRTSVDDFVRAARVPGRASGDVAEILARLRAARPRADAYRVRLHDVPPAIPVLDPLVPAIGRAVAHWGAGGRPVWVVHDRQKTLSAARIAALVRDHRLAGLTFVESGTDARVQLADILAGTARKIASDALHGRGDADLVALLRPYVDPGSVWGDERSWSILGGGAGGRVSEDAVPGA